MENTLGVEYFKECIVQFYYNFFKYSSYLFKVWIPNNRWIVAQIPDLEICQAAWVFFAFHFNWNSYISLPTSLRGVQMKYWYNDFTQETDQNLSTFNIGVDLKLHLSSGIFDSYHAFNLSTTNIWWPWKVTKIYR